MRAHAAAQRLELSLGAYADSLYSLTQVPLLTRLDSHIRYHSIPLEASFCSSRETAIGVGLFFLDRQCYFSQPGIASIDLMKFESSGSMAAAAGGEVWGGLWNRGGVHRQFW